jgi:hypothetical protein
MSQIRYYLFLLLALAAIPAIAFEPIQHIEATNFPAEHEFRDLAEIKSDITITKESELSTVTNGKVFAQAGFLRYLSRTYALAEGRSIVIEDLTLKDPRAAYSLITLLRQSDLMPGPPGDVYSLSDNTLLFARNGHFVRIENGSSSADLSRRVAISISNRIGPGDLLQPALVAHFPAAGFESATLRYFLGPFATDAYAPVVSGKSLRSESEMDVAQADYIIGKQYGKLSIINFPTIQLAEDFFENAGGQESVEGQCTYMKRAGPLLGILEGNFDRSNAAAILKPLQYRYSIRWIYDKNNRNAGSVMGIPVGILGTVVRSIVLTMLLCTASIFAGAGIAAFRLLLRKYAPNNYLDRPERTEIIRLKIDED